MDSLANFCGRFDAWKQRTAHLPHQTQALAAQTCPVARWLGWGRGLARGVVMLLGAIGIALGSVTPAHADVITCGGVLGPGGRFELEHDLECAVQAVTVRDGAILDLHGHIVACRPPIGVRCIVLTGTGAQLLNGAVQGGIHESIVLEGNGGHTVRNVTSTLVDNNIIVVQSDHNQLINVMAESAFNPAFNISGNHNRLIDNIARCFELAFGGCITVRGNENRLINNFATSTRISGANGGYLITGNHNVLRGNRAIGNDGPGIVVTGTGNRLTRNTALENALDLQDTTDDCVQNTWRDNTFRTSDPACIGQNPGGSVADLVR